MQIATLGECYSAFAALTALGKFMRNYDQFTQYAGIERLSYQQVSFM